jgi:hypothetical protein
MTEHCNVTIRAELAFFIIEKKPHKAIASSS